jgi:hypothetical protein
MTYFWRILMLPTVRGYSSRGDEVRKVYFLRVIRIKNNNFSIDELSSFMIEE